LALSRADRVHANLDTQPRRVIAMPRPPASAETDARLRLYQRVLGANLVLVAGFVALALASPATLSIAFGFREPLPADWVRVCGGMLAVVALLYLQGLLDPLGARWPNLVGIVARFAMATLFLSLGGGFLWFCLFDAAFGVLLTLTYFRLPSGEAREQPR
jgi:hypothetical protein